MNNLPLELKKKNKLLFKSHFFSLADYPILNRSHSVDYFDPV